MRTCGKGQHQDTALPHVLPPLSTAEIPPGHLPCPLNRDAAAVFVQAGMLHELYAQSAYSPGSGGQSAVNIDPELVFNERASLLPNILSLTQTHLRLRVHHCIISSLVSLRCINPLQVHNPSVAT